MIHAFHCMDMQFLGPPRAVFIGQRRAVPACMGWAHITDLLLATWHTMPSSRSLHGQATRRMSMQAQRLT